MSEAFQFLISHNDPLGNFAPIAWFAFLIQNESYKSVKPAQKRQIFPRASDFIKIDRELGRFDFFFNYLKFE